MTNFPCKHCVCKPVCKHKKYTHLFEECSIVRDVFNSAPQTILQKNELIIDLYRELRPSKWSLTKIKLKDENKILVTIRKNKSHAISMSV